jgi:sarcosine oxidase
MKKILPKSLWTATKIEHVSTVPLNDHAESDVAIIGGGITGLTTAIHLKMSGFNVTVLEAGEIGWGGSGRNGGHFNPGWKIDPQEIIARHGKKQGEKIITMVDGACDLVAEMVDRYKIECEMVRKGYVLAAVGRSDTALLQEKVRQWSDRGAPIEMIDKHKIQQILGTEYYSSGLLDLRGGKLHPLSYVCGLARAAIQAGAAVHEHSEATHVSRKGNDWTVSTPGGSVTSKFLIIATNAYTNSLWPKLRKVLVPVSSFITATEPLPSDLVQRILPGQTTVAESRRIPVYFLTSADNRLVIGSRGYLFNTAEMGSTHHIRRLAITIFSQLADIKWEFDWGGRVAITKDREPKIFNLGANAFAGMGYNGRGVPMATMMGKQLAELIVGRDVAMPIGNVKPIPLHLFHPLGVSIHVIYSRILDRYAG